MKELKFKMRPQPYLRRRIASYVCITATLLVGVSLAAAFRAVKSERFQRPEAPSISITRIPPAGGGPDRMELIAGTIGGVNVKECGCKVVIFSLGDVWYVQPYVAAPFTSIAEDGRFEAMIHLGSRYAVLLTKPTYQPPAKLNNLPAVGGEVLALSTVAAVLEQPGQDKGSDIMRVIRFSGYEWKVKTSAGRVGPGSNYFSDSRENVEVDSAGRLHLRITHRGGRWHCAEVILSRSLGYGTYTFYLATEPEQIAVASYAVLGMFTWSDASDFNHREIDCEISPWGEQGNQLGQFVIQPYTLRQNRVRFYIPPKLPLTTYSFTWRPDSVFCQSLQGHVAKTASARRVIYQHTFTENIPPAGGEAQARINLWLMPGQPPADGKELEVIISKFSFKPLP